MAPRVGLLTGPVGMGKTTIATRVAALAREQGLVCGGLLAPALPDASGRKVGIWGVDVRTAERRTLARTDLDLGGPAIGPYSFDAAALDWAVGVVVQALPDTDLVIVDEIGKLELWQGVGLAPLLPRLAAGEARRALALVREELCAELQARLGAVDPVVVVTTLDNRDDLPRRVLDLLLTTGRHL